MSRSRLDPAELGLIPVQAHVWGPTIWVNVDRSPRRSRTGPRAWPTSWPPTGSMWTRTRSRSRTPGRFPRTGGVPGQRDRVLPLPDLSSRAQPSPRDGPGAPPAARGRPPLDLAHDAASAGRTGPDMAMSTDPNGDDRVYYYFHWIFPTTYFQYVQYPGAGSTSARSACAASTTSSFATSPSSRSGHATPSWQRGGSGSSRPDHLGGRRHLRTRPARARGGFRSPGRLLPGSEWLLQHFQRVVVESMAEPR